MAETETNMSLCFSHISGQESLTRLVSALAHSSERRQKSEKALSTKFNPMHSLPPSLIATTRVPLSNAVYLNSIPGLECPGFIVDTISMRVTLTVMHT